MAFVEVLWSARHLRTIFNWPPAIYGLWPFCRHQSLILDFWGTLFIEAPTSKLYRAHLNGPTTVCSRVRLPQKCLWKGQLELILTYLQIFLFVYNTQWCWALYGLKRLLEDRFDFYLFS